jgi:hypothetical protein
MEFVVQAKNKASAKNLPEFYMQSPELKNTKGKIWYLKLLQAYR